MSGVAIIRAKLIANANLVAVVPATKIRAGTTPLNETLPAIALGSVSGFNRNTMAMAEPKTLFTERVRVTVQSPTYPLKEQIHELVRLALPNMQGALGTFTVDSILPDSKGPDFEDTAVQMHSQYRDYIVKFLINTAL